MDHVDAADGLLQRGGLPVVPRNGVDIVGSAGASLLMCFTPGETVRDELSIRIEADPIPALIEHFGPRIEHARSRGCLIYTSDAADE